LRAEAHPEDRLFQAPGFMDERLFIRQKGILFFLVSAHAASAHDDSVPACSRLGYRFAIPGVNDIERNFSFREHCSKQGGRIVVVVLEVEHAFQGE